MVRKLHRLTGIFHFTQVEISKSSFVLLFLSQRSSSVYLSNNKWPMTLETKFACRLLNLILTIRIFGVPLQSFSFKRTLSTLSSLKKSLWHPLYLEPVRVCIAR